MSQIMHFYGVKILASKFWLCKIFDKYHVWVSIQYMYLNIYQLYMYLTINV